MNKKENIIMVALITLFLIFTLPVVPITLTYETVCIDSKTNAILDISYYNATEKTSAGCVILGWLGVPVLHNGDKITVQVFETEASPEIDEEIAAGADYD